MPRLPKCYVRGSLLDVCFRAEEGLPLVPTPAMVYILKGIIGRAAQLYPTTISNLVTMANHIHMLLVVDDPAAIPLFLQYVKRETAHAINQILGRRKRTVWCDGSDDPVVLDPETALRRLSYIYLNPARANLEQSIQQYPHLHSWAAFCDGRVQEEPVFQIPRDRMALFYHRAQEGSVRRAVRCVRKLADCRKVLYRVEPFAWANCFEETRSKDPTLLREEVIATVSQEERRLRAERTRPVIGAARLMEQRMDRGHIPSKRGRRMCCRGATRDVRLQYLQWYDDARLLAKSAVNGIRRGVFAALPPGFFLPGGVLLCNVLPLSSPLAFG